MEYGIIATLSTGIIVCFYIIWNTMRKLETAEDLVEELTQEQFDTITRLKRTFNNLRTIDAKGGFESDDEIGLTFKAIKDEIEKLEGIYGK
tara:strand:- start:954 stop:1226 length:273 start_codon:yes stop_codon:yes gene_type:complete